MLGVVTSYCLVFAQLRINNLLFVICVMSSVRVKTKPIQAPIVANVPGSKSITNRALIAAALCEAEVTLTGALFSEDTEVATAALRACGVSIEVKSDSIVVDGSAWQPKVEVGELYLANAGTAVRFLSAVCCARGNVAKIVGTERMHQRPIELLLKGLRDLGGKIESSNNNGCPPLEIGEGGLKGGQTSLSGQVSSQYFSGLMMAGPLAESPCEVSVSDEWLSRPYIELTAKLLKSFGVNCEVLDEGKIVVPAPQKYTSPGSYAIEPDATAASYPLGLGVLQGVKATVKGLGQDALQGDVAFVEAMAQMGCNISYDEDGVSIERDGPLKPLVADLNEIPDAAMTAVVVCAITPGHSSLTGLKNLAFKDCDRLTALATELNKLGCRVQANADGFEIDGVEVSQLHGAKVETYKDHRMAMCLAIMGTVVDGVEILDPSCVNKTYPNFWQDLESWCG